MREFEKLIEVRWADCDLNRHVRHSIYYDYGAHARIAMFKDVGFPSARMASLDIGPIIFKEECNFIKELRLEDTVRINILKGEILTDASRWILHHELFNSENIKVAHISLSGAWLDLSKRKLASPPADLAKALHELPKGEYYTHVSKKNK